MFIPRMPVTSSSSLAVAAVCSSRCIPAAVAVCSSCSCFSSGHPYRLGHLSGHPDTPRAVSVCDQPEPLI